MYTFWEAGVLLGFFGAVPEPLSVRGEKILAYQIADAFVAPSMHGQGVFKRLAVEVFKEIDSVSSICYGRSPSELIFPILTNKFAMYIAGMYRQVYSPILFDKILTAKKLRFISPIGKLLDLFRNNPLSKPHLDIEEINHIPQSCFETSLEKYDFAIYKEPEYIKYRYELCPEEYRFYKVKDKSAQPIVMVIKLVVWNDITMCYLVDIIGDLNERNSADFMCRALYAIGLATSAAVVSVELNHTKEELSGLLYKGFLCHGRVEYLILRQERWNFLNPSSREYNSKKWLISAGDSDYM
jgi:hypothetical protein